MLGFAMDCFFAGMAMCLIIGGVQVLLTNQERDAKDFFWLSVSFGVSIFLLSRFAMGFMIMWSMWD